MFEAEHRLVVAMALDERARLEILSDSPINGFRVRSLLRFTPWVCRASEVDCADEVDDDCDGRIDADDSDCP